MAAANVAQQRAPIRYRPDGTPRVVQVARAGAPAGGGFHVEREAEVLGLDELGICLRTSRRGPLAVVEHAA
jgi:hypothetical protein